MIFDYSPKLLLNFAPDDGRDKFEDSEPEANQDLVAAPGSRHCTGGPRVAGQSSRPVGRGQVARQAGTRQAQGENSRGK